MSTSTEPGSNSGSGADMQARARLMKELRCVPVSPQPSPELLPTPSIHECFSSALHSPIEVAARSRPENDSGYHFSSSGVHLAAPLPTAFHTCPRSLPLPPRPSELESPPPELLLPRSLASEVLESTPLPPTIPTNENGPAPASFTNEDHMRALWRQVEALNLSHMQRVSVGRVGPRQVLNLSRCRHSPPARTIRQLASSQRGCRELQRWMDQDPSSVECILANLQGEWSRLMMGKGICIGGIIHGGTPPYHMERIDPFGNYLCQKLIQCSNEQQCTRFLQEVAPQFVGISKSVHGTRGAQQLVEHLTTHQQHSLLCESIYPHIMEIIVDPNATHMLQKCIQYLPPEQLFFLHETVHASFVDISRNRHGCCVVQRCMDFGSAGQVEQIVEDVAHHVHKLVQDPFGNYVVQYAFRKDIGSQRHKDQISKRLLGGLVRLAQHKFSSNVIESALRSSISSRMRHSMIAELTASSKTMDRLLRDPFGSFVLLTVLEVCQERQRRSLVDRLRTLLVQVEPKTPSIRTTMHGRRVWNKLEKYAQDFERSST